MIRSRISFAFPLHRKLISIVSRWISLRRILKFFSLTDSGSAYYKPNESTPFIRIVKSFPVCFGIIGHFNILPDYQLLFLIFVPLIYGNSPGRVLIYIRFSISSIL